MLAANGQASSYLLLSYCVAVTILLFCFNAPAPRLPHFSFSETEFENAIVENATVHNDTTPEFRDFPKKIWQTARTDLLQLPNNVQQAIGSWYQQNPGYRYESFTQQNGKSYVAEHYAHKPHIAETFADIEDGMLQADLVQYLFLLEHGGIYTDLDTICLKPIDTWIPLEYNKKANLVLGIEGDSLGGDIIDGFTYPVQFATWTMMVKPGHFVLEMIVDHVINQINALAVQQSTTIANIQASYYDIMDTTGPGIFAKTIYEALSTSSNSTVSPANLTGMTEPRLFGDILILPITSFGAGLGHSNAGGVDHKNALVQHTFAGSWKGDHPMVVHPFGEDDKEEDQDNASQRPESGDGEFPQWMDGGAHAEAQGSQGELEEGKSEEQQGHKVPLLEGAAMGQEGIEGKAMGEEVKDAAIGSDEETSPVESTKDEKAPSEYHDQLHA